MRLEELFEVERPVVGVVHLKPLPGSPRYSGSMEEVLEWALRDARALEEGGVDGMIVENYGDAPYLPGRVGPETVASMAVAVREVVRSVSVPVGVNVLRSDGEAALAIAAACGAPFIRVNVYVGAYLTDQGVIEGRSYAIARLRAALKADVKVFADVAVKHAVSLSARPLVEEALDAVERGLADALILTGPRTGEPPSFREVAELRRRVGAPVLVGSGVRLDNIEEALSSSDGVIVGTYFKEGGAIDRPVDRGRVEALVREARAIRSRLRGTG